MEESSEAHMETDVSSTTEDVPETQEVTGSQRSMEMVIVVETLTEGEEEELSEKSSDQSSPDVMSVAAETTDKSPQKDLQTQQTDSMSTVREIEVEIAVEKPSNKTGSSHTTATNDKSESSSEQAQQSGDVDSSSKNDIIISDTDDSKKDDKKSPEKTLEVHNTVQKSPVKPSHTPEPKKIKLIRQYSGSDHFKKSSTNSLPTTSKNTTPIKEIPKVDTSIKLSPVKLFFSRPRSLTPDTTKKVAQVNDSPTPDTTKMPSPNTITPIPDTTKKFSPVKENATPDTSKIILSVKVNPKPSTPIKSPSTKTSPTATTPNKPPLVIESPAPDTSKAVSPVKINPDLDTKKFSAIHAPEELQNNNGQEKLTIKTNSDKSNKKTEDKEQPDNNEKSLNDSPMETDSSEKDHNKSISRELKSLINSAKESKIISECTQLTSKTRKSRILPDSANTSLNVSVEPEKIQGNRRHSESSQKSNSSEKSEVTPAKRSMRSQNPEFVSKVKQFLNSVTAKVLKDSDDATSEDEKDDTKKQEQNEVNDQLRPSSPKKKKVSELPESEKSNRLKVDPYCWRCHWLVEQAANEKTHFPMECTVCPRSYHYKCLSTVERSKISYDKKWVCPECLLILHAESSETRSPAMKKISLGKLCDLLKHALERMMEVNGVEPFLQPVDRAVFPSYDSYVVHPMDLSQMKQAISEGQYGSTEAFQADAQWILHNSIIFNTCEKASGLQSKLTAAARALLRSCRAEMGEIEACWECYAAAHARRPTWFTDVCSVPHVLLWAKLKGFPYWPAKGMSVNCSGQVDVRFFGAHDRAWVPAKDCFLFSEKDPNTFRNKRQDILDSMQEAEQYIRNISRKYGKFVYPPLKAPFESTKLSEHIKMMVPAFEGEVISPIPVKEKSTANSSPSTPKDKSRTSSKSSKPSANDNNVVHVVVDFKALDSQPQSEEITVVSNEENVVKDKVVSQPTESAMEVDPPPKKDPEPQRKRRRSQLEEATVTIMEPFVPEKRRRVLRIASKDKPDKPEDKTDKPEDKKTTKTNEEPSSSKETQEKEAKVVKPKENKENKKTKDDEPSSSTADKDKTARVTPIRLVALPRANKNTPKTFTTAKCVPSKAVDDKATPTKQKTKPDKTATPSDKDKIKEEKTKTNEKEDKTKTTEKEKHKEDKTKALKRRSSRSSRSSNASSSTPKSSKSDKKENTKTKDTEAVDKRTDSNKTATDKTKEASKAGVGSPKSTKERLVFDDDTSLAVLARGSKHNSLGMPTISSVRSLSVQSNAKTPTPKPTVTHSAVITPTSTTKTAKDAQNKSLSLEDRSLVGKVGVCAFARMTSVERESAKEVEVEIKSEPIDLEEHDAERQMEKLDLMSAFKLMPVSSGATTLRDVRINKVVTVPVKKPTPPAPKTTAAEVRPRAKKSFPQPKKPDEGLNGKNSMVYIPIQPPINQAPVRLPRPVPNRPTPPITSVCNNNNIVNTVTTPVLQTISSPQPAVSLAGTPTVHTVPLVTSINGQLIFGLQPVMSVSGVDGLPQSPVMNGLPERSIMSAMGTMLVPAANRPNDTVIPAEPPRLQHRPLVSPLDATAAPPPAPAPPAAGPLANKLHLNATKLADFFRNLLEDSIERLEEPAARAASLALQVEHQRWKHQQETDELKHNHELMLAEMRASFEKEKLRAVSEVRRSVQADVEATIKLTKSKQWCAYCYHEAQFYCCWNTSYCDYPCQRAHWAQHQAVCTQQRCQDEANGNDSSSSASESRLHPDNLPTLQTKSTASATPPASKGPPARIFTQEPPQKTSIIVSMVEDSSGTQSMKCLGTYKPTGASPVLINKQLLTNDDAAKKVVTSGGYLIVGGAGGSGAVVTPAPPRRPANAQFFS